MTKITNCRACGSELLTEFLDLGRQYLSDFREDDSKPPKYPLVAVFCESCKLVQLKHSAPQKEMYHQNYGFKSGVNEEIRKDLDSVVVHAFQYVNDPLFWLDIGSNDGTLLSFVPDDVFRVGVDPVKFLCKEAQPHANMIINDYFSPIVASKLNVNDVITTVSCFYDMPDLEQFITDVESVLSPRGVWIIQQNYLLTTLRLGAIDNFCSEHLTYFTLSSLERLLRRFGLEVNEVFLSTINGGSIRTVVSRKGTFDVNSSVFVQRQVEQDYGVDSLSVYREFAESCMDNINQLRRLVLGLKAENKTVAILAASTRGATIWQAAELGPKELEYAVERNPAKVGKMFSAIGIPIISEEEAMKLHPSYMIIGPWFFADQIIDRYAEYLARGGKLITPFPNVEIIE